MRDSVSHKSRHPVSVAVESLELPITFSVVENSERLRMIVTYTEKIGPLQNHRLFCFVSPAATLRGNNYNRREYALVNQK